MKPGLIAWFYRGSLGFKGLPQEHCLDRGIYIYRRFSLLKRWEVHLWDGDGSDRVEIRTYTLTGAMKAALLWHEAHPESTILRERLMTAQELAAALAGLATGNDSDAILAEAARRLLMKGNPS